MTIHDIALVRESVPSIEDERRRLRELRRRMERALDEFILILDELDGDPDNEPSLGWTPAEQALGEYSKFDDEQNVEGDDHERDSWGDDNGIADDDGRADQYPSFVHGALV